MRFEAGTVNGVFTKEASDDRELTPDREAIVIRLARPRDT